jgi:hypothetical protein
MAQEAHIADIVKLINEAKTLALETKELAIKTASDHRREMDSLVSGLSNVTIAIASLNGVATKLDKRVTFLEVPTKTTTATK